MIDYDSFVRGDQALICSFLHLNELIAAGDSRPARKWGLRNSSAGSLLEQKRFIWPILRYVVTKNAGAFATSTLD